MTLSGQPVRTIPPRSSGPLLSPSLTVSFCLIAGIHLADRFALPALVLILLSAGLAVLSWRRDAVRIVRPGQWSEFPAACSLCAALVAFGAFHWTSSGPRSRDETAHSNDIAQVVRTGEAPIRIDGDVINIPVSRTRADSGWRSSSGTSSVTSQFLLRCRSLQINGDSQVVTGEIRVSVDGDALDLVQWGDHVQMTGRLETAFPVRNPGEFDYQKFLARQGISGIVFVRHPLMIRVSDRRPAWHPKSVLSVVRTDASALLERHLSPEFRPLAEALLLGNRGHLDPALERAFIVSGTMHLLAISGLHVGILYVFLVRALHLLIVGRRNAVLIALAVCIGYAFLTDLRPSVLRATAFIALSVLAQLLNREVRMSSLIGNTTCVFVLLDPGVAFDLGAWLSFLAVAALAWVASLRASPKETRSAPPDAMTLRERLEAFGRGWIAGLAFRYQQMLAVSLFSLPLVASQFHVISASGILVNVVLIPLTGIAMVSGFLFVGAGMLVPILGSVTGAIFGTLLRLLHDLVGLAAGFDLGSLTIPNLPPWFLGAYYSLLVVCLCLRGHTVVRGCWTGLVLLVLIVFWQVNQRPVPGTFACTVLSVGHGNAVIVESPDGHVLVFDAGALHRAERTSETVSRFLWTRGYRMIDSLIVSHADADHYNGVPGLFERMPVGQLITTREFARSTDAPIAELRESLRRRQIPVTLVMNGDSATCGRMTIQFQQATLSRSAIPPDDNELSLVAVIHYAGRTLCLPGDLERRGQVELADLLPMVDVLVSPHHGGRTSNTTDTAAHFCPQTLIVSAGSTDCEAHLNRVYSPHTDILNTADRGAVTVQISEETGVAISSFRSRDAQ